MAGYAAARERAAFMDRSDRLRMKFSGAQAAATLNGLLTNDVAALTPGTGCYAAALTAKGKIIADVRVFARHDDFLMDCSATAAPGLLAMLRKYVNPRLAKYQDVSAELCAIGVFGPHAARAVAGAVGGDAASLAALGLFAHASPADAVQTLVARVPDLGVLGFDIIAPRDATDTIVSSLSSGGAAVLDTASAEVMRVEAGRPLFGADMDENVLAQEAGLDGIGAISFDKGCYTGQETVARVHFRGHVNRTLRGIVGSDPMLAGAELVGAEGTVVGQIRSTVISPSLGPIALAYVRREVADGSAVLVRSSGVDATATVVALPFM